MDLQGRNLSQDLSGADVAELQKTLGELGLSVPAAEQSAAGFGAGRSAAVMKFQGAQGIQVTGVVDAATAAALGRAILLSTFTVTGTVTSSTRAGVADLAVQLVDKNIGADVAVGAGVTDGQGGYNVSVKASRRAAGIEPKPFVAIDNKDQSHART